MAGVIGNLVYRVSVSAIVGAIVAGGLIYINNDRVLKSFRAHLETQFEQQNMTNKALMEANEELATAVGIIESENTQRLAEFNEQLRILGEKIDSIPESEAADYSTILDAINALKAETSAQLSQLQAQHDATQEQGQ